MESGHEGLAADALHDDSFGVHRDVHHGRCGAEADERGCERRLIAGGGGEDQCRGENR